MANIESIKQKILQLDAGTFQNLCDSYLCKIGYSNIVSLGGEAGTRKTTYGTPDTYFRTLDGKYVFVEYTTQRASLFSKIKDDLAKCLDTSRTGITLDKISEIIYCHTSSNITPSQDDEITTLCKNAGIKLTVIGIDRLAEDLYLFNHSLARDFLGISISTDQIRAYNDFIRSYNANKIAAPINTDFLFRNEEIENINKAYQKVDIVILSGVAGTGKTRLALQYAKKYSKTYNTKLYCIHSNALPIYEDLKVYIDNPGSYFLLIDDANQLSGLRHIVRYTTMKSEGYNVKILITVRDYATQKVINDIREINSYENINISIFTDDEIKKLLETALGIKNPEYQDRIARIAEGNARIAILAGRIACNTNRLDSINDVSQLYDDYYGCFLEKDQLFVDEHMYIVAGVVAFLEAIHLDHLDVVLPILQEKGLHRDSFIENIRKLHEREIVDVYNDKAVRFSEQCLANYVLKCVFFDKRLLSLSKMINACFQNYKERTVSSINTLLNIFRNENIFSFVENEIKILWVKLAKENSPYYFDFVRVFFHINPTETLLLLQDNIESEKSIHIAAENIDIEKGKNYQNVSNYIIEILGGFADTEDFPAALDLFFQYYLKRPDLYIQFYHAANLYFGIKKDSEHYGFYTQITFFEKIKEYSNNWKQESIVILFLEVAEEFLKLHFTPTEGGRKNTFIMYQIPLVLSEGVEKYRKLIWEFLAVLCESDKSREKIRKVLQSYGGTIDEISNPVLQFDLSYIKSIMESYFPPHNLKNCLLANDLAQVFIHANISCERLFAEYFEEEYFCMYSTLKGPNYQTGVDYNDQMKLKHQLIQQYVSACGLKEFKRLIDVCSGVNDLDGHTAWRVGEGLGIAFDAISHETKYYVDAIKYYIEKNTPSNLNPCHLVSTLFSLLPDSEVFYIINGNVYSQKNAWLYAFYHELPVELITEKHVEGLYDFLADTSDASIISSPFRDVDFLMKYSIIDKEVFIKGCKIILSKMEYSTFMVQIYFDLLFNHFHNTPQVVISRFRDNIGLLEEIYCTILSCNNNHDYSGQFLEAIYLVKQDILDKYIEYLIDNINKSAFCDHQERHRCFFELDDFLEIYNKIFEQLLEHTRYPEVSVPYFLESILIPVENDRELLERQDKWIKQCIQLFANDHLMMHCLFEVIAKLKIDRKKEYFFAFLERNESFEDFKNLSLIPASWSWSGSAVPMYSGWTEFLELLLPRFIGLKWIRHKNYVKKKIEWLKKQIEDEQIHEILRG